MVHNSHKKWREAFGTGNMCGQQDLIEDYGITKAQFRSLRRSNPTIPYTLEIESSSYWGNYEREFLGYAIGILDDVQMHIEFADTERLMFWKEVFNKDEAPDFDEALEDYELLRDYLYETFQDCDDWWQLTFYGIDWDSDKNILKVQLVKPLSKYWEDIIIPRMKTFFEKKIYKHLKDNDKLISIRLYDKNRDLVKEYEINNAEDTPKNEPTTPAPRFSYPIQCREYLNTLAEDYPLNNAVIFFKSPVTNVIEVRHVFAESTNECLIWAQQRLEEYTQLNIPFAIYRNGLLFETQGELFD